MDEGTVVNVPYLLAQYLFRHVWGRKAGAHMLGGHFIAQLLMDTVSWVAEDPPRKQVGAAGRGAEIDLEGLQDAPMG
ncbi:hypothetical protein Tco_1149146 [Tanacetum coccineum]